METSNFITFENVTFIIALGGIMFGIYHFFRNPDIAADKRICLIEKMLEDEKIKNELLIKNQQNHLHSIEVSVNKNNENIKTLTNEFVKLSTIIDERIPKKKL